MLLVGIYSWIIFRLLKVDIPTQRSARLLTAWSSCHLNGNPAHVSHAPPPHPPSPYPHHRRHAHHHQRPQRLDTRADRPTGPRTAARGVPWPPWSGTSIRMPLARKQRLPGACWWGEVATPSRINRHATCLDHHDGLRALAT
jgi:hypothetical protein